MPSYLEKLFSLFRPQPVKNDTGLLLDSPQALEALPKHEIFAGGNQPMTDWSKFCPDFRYQGSTMWCTAFAGTTIAHILNKKELGSCPLFSPVELFSRSGGSPRGNYLINAANAMKESLVLEEDIPTPLLSEWDYDIYLKWINKGRASKAMIDRGRPYRCKDAAVVQPNRASILNALQSSPLMIAVGVGRGYFDLVAPRQSSYGSLHAVVLEGVDEMGNYKIFDSITNHQGFSGHHKLARDYDILTALSFIDLPTDWRDIQEKQNPFKNALNHYGKHRILAVEQHFANVLVDALKSHPTLSSYFGREWSVAVNALSYGDFTLTDLLNHYTNIRRTGRPIFDLNAPKR